MKRNLLSVAVVVMCAISMLSSCKKDEIITPVLPLKVDTVELKTTANPTSSNYTLLNFVSGDSVTYTQQNTTNWDLGIAFTTIVVNKSPYGPGNAGVQIVDGTFSGITTAPTTGYTESIADYNTWALYNPTTRSFSPKPGKIFVFKTATGSYAKMEILAVDYGPLAGTPPYPTYIKYTLRYSVQTNGTNLF